MTTKLSQIRTTWWKFDRYVIERGEVLPGPGAKIRPASPWKDYQASKDHFGQSREQEGDRRCPPYLDLLELARISERYVEDVLHHRDKVITTPPEIEERVLALCATHGLLGLLHERVVQLVRPGSRRTWYREGGVWTLDATTVMAGLPDCLMRFGNQSIQRVGFEGLRWQHFNTAKLAPNPIPHPTSREFFEYYTESVYDILLAAYTFRRALEVDWAQNRSLDACNALMSGVSTQFHLEKGQLVQEPVYASLLAAFADMALRDLMAGLRLGRCQCCGQMLVTNYERTKYCSVQCRWRVVKQRSRGQAKADADALPKRVERETPPNPKSGGD